MARSGCSRWYLGTVPTYSLVYGAFATVPIFLVWIYIGWVIVLLGAVIAAYCPACWPASAGPAARRLAHSSSRSRCCATLRRARRRRGDAG